MVVNRVEQQIIRKSHPLWIAIDEMCFNAKNLYNYAKLIILLDRNTSTIEDIFRIEK